MTIIFLCSYAWNESDVYLNLWLLCGKTIVNYLFLLCHNWNLLSVENAIRNWLFCSHKSSKRKFPGSVSSYTIVEWQVRLINCKARNFLFKLFVVTEGIISQTRNLKNICNALYISYETFRRLVDIPKTFNITRFWMTTQVEIFDKNEKKIQLGGIWNVDW